MPASLKKLTSKTNRLKIEIDGDPEAITVEYSTRKLTPRIQQELAALARDPDADPDGQRAVIMQFLSIVVGWDLAANEGEPPIPLTDEALLDMPVEILGAILDALATELDAQRPKETTAT